MDTLGVGMIGSGFMGLTYSEALARHVHGARLVAVAGGKRAPELAKDYGVAAESSIDALLARIAVARDAHGLDHPHIELARHDGGGDETAAGDADDRLERARAGESPSERAGVAMELVPGDRKDLFRLLDDGAARCDRHVRRPPAPT